MSESMESWRRRDSEARERTTRIRGKEPAHNEVSMAIVAGLLGFVISTAALAFGGVPIDRSELITLGITTFCAGTTYFWQRHMTTAWYKQYSEFLGSSAEENR